GFQRQQFDGHRFWDQFGDNDDLLTHVRCRCGFESMPASQAGEVAPSPKSCRGEPTARGTSRVRSVDISMHWPPRVSSPAPSPLWLRSTILAAWATLALLTAVSVRNLVDWMHRPEGNDLSVYLAAARALVTGGDPYAVPLPQGFSVYTLTIAALLVPLTWLPITVAQFGWFALNVAALPRGLC